MNVVHPEESDSLKARMIQAVTRNPAASFKHIDADAEGELPFTHDLAGENVTDRYARRTIESGLCWRDPMVASPQIRDRARK